MHSFKNNVHLEGNLGKDATLKTTSTGDVVNFSIAINERWKDKQGKEQTNTDWFDIEVWGPMTKFAATLKSGTPVVIEGKVSPGSYTKDNIMHKTVSIRANSIRKIDYTHAGGEESTTENLDAE